MAPQAMALLQVMAGTEAMEVTLDMADMAAVTVAATVPQVAAPQAVDQAAMIAAHVMVVARVTDMEAARVTDMEAARVTDMEEAPVTDMEEAPVTDTEEASTSLVIRDAEAAVVEAAMGAQATEAHPAMEAHPATEAVTAVATAAVLERRISVRS